MPKIPVYEQQVAAKSVVADRPQQLNPVQGASGANIAAANERLGQTLLNVGDKVMDRMQELQKREEDRQVLEQETRFRKEMQNTLYSKEVDENGRPVGVLNRNLSQAVDATPEFDQKFQDMKSRYLNSVSSQRQKDNLTKLMDEHYSTSRNSVIKHEATQGEQQFTESLKTNLDQRIADAALISNPSDLQYSVEESKALQANGLKHLGHDAAAVELGHQDLVARMAKSSVSAILDKNPQQAQALLEAVRPQMNAASAVELQKIIDGKLFDDQRVATWGQVNKPEFKLADGTLDYQKTHDYIFNLPDVSTEKKEKLFDYAKAMGNEQHVAKKQREAANEFSFMNELSALHKGFTEGKPGADLPTALRLVGKYGLNPNDSREKEELVKKMYAREDKTNVDTYYALHSGIIKADGSVSAADINQARLKGLLTGHDWMELRQKQDEIAAKGANLEEQYVYSKLERAALKDGGVDKEELPQFMHYLKSQVQGKNPAETLQIGTDLIKKVPGTGFTWFDIGQKRKYEIDKKDYEQTHLSLGELYQTAGKDVVQAVGNTPDQFAAFASKIGGPDVLRDGQPANAAVKSLNALGKPVTPQNVFDVLKKFPNGKIPTNVQINFKSK